MIGGICFGAMVLSIWFLTEFKIHLFNSIYKAELDSSNIGEFIFLKFNQPIFKTDFTSGAMLNCAYRFWRGTYSWGSSPDWVPKNISMIVSFGVIGCRIRWS